MNGVLLEIVGLVAGGNKVATDQEKQLWSELTPVLTKKREVPTKDMLRVVDEYRYHSEGTKKV